MKKSISMQQLMDTNLTTIKDYQEENYKVFFNKRNGFFARVENDGYSEPFWAKSGPELLDIAITNYCSKDCSICYRNSNPQGVHMRVEDYKSIINQAKEANAFQIALGGGNPNQHPEFIDILKYTYDNGIVPSYTTNGIGLTDEILKATKQYCGAVALSAHENDEELAKKIDQIQEYKIKLNVHFVLSSLSISRAIHWLQDKPFFLNSINAIIFLNYKPINASNKFLLKNSDKVDLFFRLVSKQNGKIKIGFDSCSISGIVEYMKTNPMFIESCEAARFSAFISEDLKMFPCSFMVNKECYGDLKKETLINIWQNNECFKNFRDRLNFENCSNCQQKSICNGGCIYLPEINVCEMKKKISNQPI